MPLDPNAVTPEELAAAVQRGELSDHALEAIVAGKGENGAFSGPRGGAIRTDNVTAVRGPRGRAYYSGPNSSGYRGAGGRTFISR